MIDRSRSSWAFNQVGPRLGLCLASLGLLLTVGCYQPTPVRQVEVPKPQRSLVAMLVDQPHGTAWFIKLSGPSSMVDRQEKDFRAFVDSFTIDSTTGEPSWQAPAHWHPVEAGEIFEAEFSVTPRIVGSIDAYREASEGASGSETETTSPIADLSSPSTTSSDSASAEVTKPLPFDDYRVQISKLPLPAEGDLEAYRLINVNRWRRQLAVAPIDQLQLAMDYPVSDHGGLPMTWVDLRGRLPDGAEENAAGVVRAPSIPPEMQSLRNQIRFETPAGWTEPPSGAQFAALTLEKKDGNATSQITLSLMNAQMPWETQAERWAGQVGLRLTAEELQQRTEKIEVSGVEAEKIDLASPEADAPDSQRIIAIRVVNGASAWFIRIKGRPSFIEAERESFEAFVKSLELPW